MIAQLDSRYLGTRPTRAWARLVAYFLFEGRPLTTRGRWINPLLVPWFAGLGRLPQVRRVDRPIFLVGTGRSGTTVLGKALSMHREIGFLNEPKALWHHVHPHDDLIGSYSREAARYRLDTSDATAGVRRRAERLYGAYLALSGSRRVLDKYPEMLFRADFLRAIFPGAKFLLLVRNGFDTCSSIGIWSERHRSRHRKEIHDWWGADDRKWRLLVEQLVPEHSDLATLQPRLLELDNGVDRAAVEWVVTMREGRRLREEHPDDVFEVRFEELTRRPLSVIQQILRFAGLPADPICLDYAESLLRPLPPRGGTAPSAIVRPAFEETMLQLGYTG